MFTKFFSSPSTSVAAPTPTAQPASPSAVTAAPERRLPTIAPAVDIWEDDRRVVVDADLPGVAQDGVEVSVHRGVLTIRATPSVVDARRLHPVHREWQPAAFERSFTLADDLDDGAVTATVTNGVLRVQLPKRASAQPRRVPVTAA